MGEFSLIASAGLLALDMILCILLGDPLLLLPWSSAVKDSWLCMCAAPWSVFQVMPSATFPSYSQNAEILTPGMKHWVFSAVFVSLHICLENFSWQCFLPLASTYYHFKEVWKFFFLALSLTERQCLQYSLFLDHWPSATSPVVSLFCSSCLWPTLSDPSLEMSHGPAPVTC